MNIWCDGGASRIVPDDLLATLGNCEGYYTCPTDETDRPQGPLVGYAGTYTTEGGKEEHLVGLTYYNFSMADRFPAVRRHFARILCDKVRQTVGQSSRDVMLGAPWAGVRLSSALAEELNCLDLHAEKVTLEKGAPGQRDREDIILKRYKDDIPKGARVFVGEELVNNITSAKKLVALIEDAGAEYAGITCAINRNADGVTEFMGKPIISALYVPTPQYRQDDSFILEAVGRGMPIIFDPKPAWATLKAAMDEAGRLEDERRSSDSEERWNAER